MPQVQWSDPSTQFELDVASGVTLQAGDIVYEGGSGLAKSDADSVSTPGEFIVVKGGVGGSSENGKAVVSKRCVLYDPDAGFTVGPYYLSTTAGEYATTRPSGAADLRQVVGQAHTTSRLELNIAPQRDVEVAGVEVLLQDTAARLINDTGPAAGVTLAAVNDNVVYQIAVPQNAIAIVDGYAPYGCDVTLDSSDTVSASIATATSGEANDVDTDSIAATGLSCTADQIAHFDLSGGLDGITCRPGGTIWIDLVKAAEGGAGDDPIFMAPRVTFRTV